jgi:hypothetical protein
VLGATRTAQVARLSGQRYFWVHLAQLAAGTFGLCVAHRMAGATRPWTIALAVVSLLLVSRSVHTIVRGGFSDAYRVFRARHLLGCSVALFTGAALAVEPLVVGEPFGRLFAHGRITASEVADLGSMVAVITCAVGAVVTSQGAWEARRNERFWSI